MLTERPSIFRIIQTDYYALLGFVMPTVLILFSAYDLYQGKNLSTFNLVFVGAVVVIGLLILVARVTIIGRVFEDGLEEMATISSSGFFRGRATIRYVYTFQGEKYTGANQVQSSKRTKAMVVGLKQIVMVDRAKPKRAFIKDLYL